MRSKLRINVDITVAMRCQCKCKNIHIWQCFMPENMFTLCVWWNADVGADVLDLAETMVASDGLKYEPVSNTRLHCSFACQSYNLLNIAAVACLAVN